MGSSVYVGSVSPIYVTRVICFQAIQRPFILMERCRYSELLVVPVRTLVGWQRR